ncbi:hypothetical protein [Melissospora conviva]|uniref:hypothetical protein n=1 Tax=Melissospora conviva TaxID=3388432 RepID=UPI003C2676E2
MIIKAGDAEATCVQDLKDATPEELKRISIFLHLRDGFISVLLSPRLSMIENYSSGPEADQTADDIAHFINKDRRSFWLPITSRPYSFALLTCSAILMLLSFYMALKPGTTSISIQLAIIFAVCAILLAALIERAFVRKFGGVQVSARWRQETRRFTAEMQRSAQVAVLGSIVGAVVTALFTLFK